MTELDEGSGTTRPGARPRDLPALPAGREGAVFEEPWQATAFALAVHLSERGAILWGEWSAALGHEIQAAAGDPALDHGYFQHWLRALERICAEKGMVDPSEIRLREEEWRRAYLSTPHGEPVELTAARRSTLR
jgi:nitrile hydratase accessory protein